MKMNVLEGRHQINLAKSDSISLKNVFECPKSKRHLLNFHLKQNPITERSENESRGYFLDSVK